jgi:hypothetical protein
MIVTRVQIIEDKNQYQQFFNEYAVATWKGTEPHKTSPKFS